MTNKTPLSNCCEKKMFVTSGDEGTNYYVCAGCGRACDAGCGEACDEKILEPLTCKKHSRILIGKSKCVDCEKETVNPKLTKVMEDTLLKIENEVKKDFIKKYLNDVRCVCQFSEEISDFFIKDYRTHLQALIRKVRSEVIEEIEKIGLTESTGHLVLLNTEWESIKNSLKSK